MEAIDLNRYYIDYPMKRQTRDFATQRAFINRLNFLRNNGLQKKHSILDYGCGTGLFISFLKENGFNAMGYDPYIPEFSDPNILNEKFDYVCSQDVIEHVSEPRELIDEYSHLLKKEGILVIGTPNAEEIKLEKTQKFLTELHQPYHQHILSEQALTKLCQQKGFNSWL